MNKRTIIVTTIALIFFLTGITGLIIWQKNNSNNNLKSNDVFQKIKYCFVDNPWQGENKCVEKNIQSDKINLTSKRGALDFLKLVKEGTDREFNNKLIVSRKTKCYRVSEYDKNKCHFFESGSENEMDSEAVIELKKTANGRSYLERSRMYQDLRDDYKANKINPENIIKYEKTAEGKNVLETFKICQNLRNDNDDCWNYGENYDEYGFNGQININKLYIDERSYHVTKK
jgi:hypothetical protein